MRRFLLILTLLYSHSGFAYEVDQFTRRDRRPQDSTEILDAEINLRVTQALNEANSGLMGSSIGKHRCDGTPDEQKESRLKLFSQLRDKLTNQNPIGLLETFAESNKNIQKRKINIEDSIYRTAQEHSQILKKFGIASVIQVNQVQIGSDKLGHFFNEGYSLYLQNYKRQDSSARTKSILFSSQSSESSFFGLETTKVKSYADLAANYDGSQFWNKLCGWPEKNISVSEKKYFESFKCAPNAYLKCENGNWAINPKQKISLKDFVTAAWDESINCSSFHEDIRESVFSEMTQRVYTYKGNPKQPCPAEPFTCLKLQTQYPAKVLNGILNPICKNIGQTQKKSPEVNLHNKSNSGVNKTQ